MEIFESLEKLGYEKQLKEIMSLNKGETFDVEYFCTKESAKNVFEEKEYLTGRDKAIEYAEKNGYIESIYVQLCWDSEIMTYKRL